MDQTSGDNGAVPERRWHTVAPVRCNFDEEDGLLDEPFEIGERVSFGPVPAWFRDKAIPTELGSFERRENESLSRAIIVERVVKGWSRPGRAEDEEDEDRVRLAQLSLWIAGPLKVEYDHVIQVEPPSPNGIRFCAGWRNLPVVGSGLAGVECLKAEHLSKARAVYAAALEERQPERRGPLWVALRMSALAMDQHHPDVAFLLLWVGLEALFSPAGSGETVYRTSQRMALFLESDRSQARELFRKIKAAYDRRSKVVHGRSRGLLLKKGEAEAAALRALEESAAWLRDAVLRIVANPELLRVFSAGSRDAYLDALLFGEELARAADASDEIAAEDGASPVDVR